MTIGQKTRRIAGLMSGGLALIELTAAAWVAAFGPLRLLPRDASTLLLIGVLAGSVAVWLLEPFRSAAVESRVGRICRVLAYAAAALSIVPLAAPILLPDFLIGHDAGAHQTYAFLFNRALTQGQFPVRWVEGVAYGLGQPLFNYYQVGFYYLVALVHWLGPGLSLAFKLTVVVQWAAGAIFMFLLCRPLGALPATLAAAVYMWSPYLLLNAYVRTAYPELTAIGFVPAVFWSIDRVLRTGRPLYVCTLALTTGLLLISHLPTALIVAPVAAAYLLGASIVQRPAVRVVALAVAGAVVGAGLAAFYLVPAIFELNAVNISRLTVDYFDYHRHFVRPEWWFDRSWGYGGSGTGAEDQLSLQIGIVQWIVLAAALGLLAIPALRRRAFPAAALAGSLAVVAVALFMMTGASVFVWESIGPLAFIQFPWRLLMLPTLACAVLAAILLSAVPSRTAQALLVVCVVALQWYVTADYRAMASKRERASITIDYAAWPSTSNARKWAFHEPAYDPVSVKIEKQPADGRWSVIEGPGNVTATLLSDAQLGLLVRSPEPTTLVVNSPYISGWHVTLDDQLISPSVDPQSGFMAVRVPAGSHRVDAVFGDNRLREASELISLASIVIWLGFACWPAWHLRRNALARFNHRSNRDPRASHHKRPTREPAHRAS